MTSITLVSEADVSAFRAVRPRLFGIAYRVLGRRTDAEDVVQEAWIRWQQTDRRTVRDAPAFLATATTRLAINAIQSAYARREKHIAESQPETADLAPDPALSVERNDDLERGLRMLIEKLSPVEREAFVLREAFDCPYRQIAQTLGVSEANARQLTTRARMRLG